MGRLTKRVKSNVPPLVLKMLDIEEVPTEDVEIIKADSDTCNSVCEQYECSECPINEAFEKLAHYEDLEEQGRLIDRDKLIMSIADWQMTLTPADNEADVSVYNMLESVIEHIADFDTAKLKELEG